MKPLKGHEQSNVEIENKVVASFTGNKLFNYQQGASRETNKWRITARRNYL